MRRLAVFLSLLCLLSLPVSAAYIPESSVTENRDGRQLIIKTYQLSPEDDPSELVDEPFDLEGYHYEHLETVKEDQTFHDSKAHTETVTVTTSSDSLAAILEQLAPTMTQLVDLIAINELTGTLESDGDGVNANTVAALPEESLSAQAAEFQASTNDDTIGWIQIPNTNVDYPVVYKAGVENYAYYESLGYDKQYSKDGVIWADYECTFPELSQNTTLYGHNWYNIYTPRTLENMQSNDLMFSLVMSYHYTDFAQQNPFIYFSTTEQDYVFQVFAAFYTDLSFGYNFANMTQEQTQQVIAEAKAKSRQNYNVSVTSEDKILTLSTCTRMYGNTNNQRFVVMAKLVPAGTPSTTNSTHPNAVANTDKVGRE